LEENPLGCIGKDCFRSVWKEFADLELFNTCQVYETRIMSQNSVYLSVGYSFSNMCSVWTLHPSPKKVAKSGHKKQRRWCLLKS